MPKHSFSQFQSLFARVRDERVGRWSEVETDFLSVVGEFDSEYALGERKPGWYQGKARYFNDIIVQLLCNVSGKPISLRRKKRSRLFELIDIDICFPGDGTPMIAGEVKALGTPPHPGNDGKARGGASDLHKRAREVAFTSLDLKAAYAPPQQIGSFQKWIDSTSPGYFSFWAIRASDEPDLGKTLATLTGLRSYCNGVGAVLYTPRSEIEPTSYLVAKSRGLFSIDNAIGEMAQRIA